MRSAPTLKIWMTPSASVAMLEKLTLLKIASCSAPAFSKGADSRSPACALRTQARLAPCEQQQAAQETQQQPDAGKTDQ
jgi:hypothetical protein